MHAQFPVLTSVRKRACDALCVRDTSYYYPPQPQLICIKLLRAIFGSDRAWPYLGKYSPLHYSCP